MQSWALHDEGKAVWRLCQCRNPASFSEQLLLKAAGRRAAVDLPASGGLFWARSLRDRCWFWENRCRWRGSRHTCASVNTACVWIINRNNTDVTILTPDRSKSPCGSIFYYLKLFVEEFCCGLSLNTRCLSTAAVMMQMGALPAALNTVEARLSSWVLASWQCENSRGPSGGFARVVNIYC